MGFSLLLYVEAIFCTFAYYRDLFSYIFLHFLQKYRCVPESGFSADFSIDISIDILIEISIDISIDILIGILLTFA